MYSLRVVGAMQKYRSSKTVAPAPQRMQRDPPKPFCETDEEAKE